MIDLTERDRPIPQRDWRVKFKRADDHLRWLQNETEWFLNTNPYRLGAQFDPQTRKNRLIVESVTPPPLRWCGAIGDCVQNLRASLDHIIYRLWETNPDSGPPTDQTEFPIFTDATKYAGAKPRKIGGLSERAKAVVESLQPCHGGDGDLTLLHDLSRVDKHRTLHLILLKSSGATITTGGRFASVWEFPPLTRLEPGAILAEFQAQDVVIHAADEIDAEMAMDLDTGIYVAFEEAGPLPELTQQIGGLPVLGVLERVTTATAHALDRLETAFTDLV